MHSKRFVSYLTILTALFLLTMALTASAASIPRMSTDELKSQLGDDGLVVLDVRGSWDWDKSDEVIAGSERVDPRGADQWAKNYSKEKTIVLYCS